MPSSYQQTSYSSFSYDEVIGVALNGVPIYPSRDSELYDFIQPQAYGFNTSP